jgi:hypothetical protein
MIPKRKKAKLNLIVLFSAKIILTMDSDATTTIVGIRIHLLSKGFRSAINNNIPQEKATADMSPIGYTISVNPTLSGIKTKIAMLKSAIAAVQ